MEEKERLIALLKELAAIPGGAGYEHKVVARLYDLLLPLADEVSVDRFGNLTAVKHGGEPGPRFMIAAHSDEIGCLVKSVDERGFLRMYRNGGVIETLLVGRKVLVNGHFGVVGVKPGHVTPPAERLQTPGIDDLYVDVGARSAAEVAEMGITPGAPITYLDEINQFTNPDLLCGKGIDNRLGCAMLVVLLEGLQGKTFAGTLYLVSNVQEEIGLRGAHLPAYRLNPDFAVVIDTTPAGGTPEVRYCQDLPVLIGQGPCIHAASGQGYNGIVTPPTLLRFIVGLAKAEGLPYQVAPLAGANTDAAAIHLIREGIPAIAVTLPRRYSHSPVEMLDINDALATMTLLRAVVAKASEADLRFL